MQQLQHTGRNVDHRMPVARTSFQQRNAGTGFAEPRRDHATGRTGADDDVIGIHRSGPREAEPTGELRQLGLDHLPQQAMRGERHRLR